MKFVFCTIVASFLLIGCSSDGDDDNDVPLVLPADVADNGAVVIDNNGAVAVDTVDNGAVDIADDDTVEIPVSDIPSVEYMDSFISLRYPSSWLLNPNGQITGVDAQFLAPQANVLGGTDNCSFSTIFDPSLTLLDAVDGIIGFFDSVPEPQEEFLEVNGVPAARVTGNLSALGVQIPTIAQIMSLNGLQVLGICAGYDEEAFDLMLGSVSFN